jgi:hypothetical protein
VTLAQVTAVIALHAGLLLPPADAPYGAANWPNYSYGVPCDLAPQSFQNITLYFFLRGEKMDAPLSLGKYSFKGDPGFGFQETSLETVNVLEAHGKQPTRVLVLSSWVWGGGSSNSATVVQLFDCANGKLHVSQQITSDNHGGGNPGIKYDSKHRTLTVRSVDAGSGPHCCPTKMHVTRYQWDTKVFRRISHRIIPIAGPE